ncbi:MAG: hypothetical protein CV089_05155 [Nitrospira sp. WS110]|nr:hypothetical protein [Nitrospira sp. WS110]
MLQHKIAIVAYLLASALLSTVATHAATYYVATSGNNNNPGTSSQPWKTIAYATSKMVAGDTTYVKGGTYQEGVIRFARSGTQSAPIKLLNAPGGFPIINFIDKTKGHRILIQLSAGSQYKIGWITIEGFEIRNGYDGIKYYNLHDSNIRRNWIHHNGFQGIMGVGGTRVLFDRNRINHNGRFAACAAGTTTSCSHDHGIYAHGSAYTITNNLFYDNIGYGVQQNGSSTSTSTAGPEFAGAKNWVIANNTFAYQYNRSGIVLWGPQSSNTRIENNIFYENAVKGPSYAAQGINFTSGGKGNTIRNNLAFASGSGGRNFIVGGTAGVNYTLSNNIINTDNPKFVNAPATLPSSPNFAIASGSPAVNKGLTTSATKNSYTNVSRPQLSLYDIGAFEFYSSSASLSAPTSLQVAK